MAGKVILILVDGMRPDAIAASGNADILNGSAYTLTERTVMPSVTLPCHMSLFHSVEPARHGITTNTYVPQVRPIEGLCERLNRMEKKCAFFITWEELRDLSRPDSLAQCTMMNLHKQADTDRKITDAALDYIAREKPDFLFLYLGETDERGGHDAGWMSKTYLEVVDNALAQARRVFAEAGDEYDIFLTADHGGHDRGHGTDLPEDMTVPLICRGPHFRDARPLGDLSILDIAPTIADITGVTGAKEWEGRSFA